MYWFDIEEKVKKIRVRYIREDLLCKNRELLVDFVLRGFLEVIFFIVVMRSFLGRGIIEKFNLRLLF